MFDAHPSLLNVVVGGSIELREYELVAPKPNDNVAWSTAGL
jgi:hypothetical protein